MLLALDGEGTVFWTSETGEGLRMNDKLENWVLDILADPLTKLQAGPDAVGITNGIVDARRYLPNTIGFDVWSSG